MSTSEYNYQIQLTGVAGSQTFEIPNAFTYITIINATQDNIVAYEVSSNPPTFIGSWGTYFQSSIPLGLNILSANNFNIQVSWNGASTGIIRILFSSQPLITSTSLSTASGTSSNVVINGDNVGLVKSNQLPTTLTALGNTKVAIEEDAVGLVKSTQLPNTLTALGNTKMAIEEDAVGLVKAGQLASALTTFGNAKIAIEEYGFKYLNITSNTTTIVKAASGVLVGIIIGTAGTATTATLYDNISASAPIIATLSTTIQNTINFKCIFNTALTIVTAGTTAANITVIYI